MKTGAPYISTLPEPAQTPLLDALPVNEVMKLRQLSRTCMDHVKSYERITFYDEQLYGPFFNDTAIIALFRRKQAECRVLVSGSTVALLLARSPHKPSDLDIFMPMIHVDTMENFIGTAGYKIAVEPKRITLIEEPETTSETQTTEHLSEDAFEEDSSTDYLEAYSAQTVGKVLTFHHENGQQLQIVGTKCEPIEAILDFYSTLVMNIATATKIISFYPYTSFVEQKAVYLKKWTPAVTRARIKYERRGWSTVDMINAKEALDYHHELSFKARWVGDRHSWISELSPLPDTTKLEEAYASGMVTSWGIGCPKPRTMRIEKNVMACNFLQEPLVITWEAEKALWAHHCIGAFNHFGRVVDWVPIDENSLAIRLEDISLPERQVATSSQTTRFLAYNFHSPPVGKVAPAEHIFNKRSSSWIKEVHSESETMLKLHRSALKFLPSFYNVSDIACRKDYTLQELLYDFIRVWNLYDTPQRTVTFPTGHVVWLILRCVDDVKNTRHTDTVTVDLEFTVDREHNRIFTTAYLLVPNEKAEKIKEEVAFWSAEEFRRAGLDVRVMSDSAPAPSDE
ncbi:hypothetical protein VNI00_008957 [Paramarasmius palmivorus]|uniref:F-box domain-containing protein n=1 Tax=Paramarasmius palmivorus TaxID=297713 RepID=A0AAW0CU94_9AGAR